MSKINIDLLKVVSEYYRTKQENDKQQELFEQKKKDFYNKMSEYWKNNNIQDKTIKGNNFSITKVQKVKIDFDIEKLKSKLSKSILKQVLKKKYTINDIDGFLDCLKSCKISKEQFKAIKEFIIVDESVDEKKINKLTEVGDIKSKDIEGTYTTFVQAPYYTIKTEYEKSED